MASSLRFLIPYQASTKKHVLMKPEPEIILHSHLWNKEVIRSIFFLQNILELFNIIVLDVLIVWNYEDLQTHRDDRKAQVTKPNVVWLKWDTFIF